MNPLIYLIFFLYHSTCMSVLLYIMQVYIMTITTGPSLLPRVIILECIHVRRVNQINMKYTTHDLYQECQQRIQGGRDAMQLCLHVIQGNMNDGTLLGLRLKHWLSYVPALEKSCIW